MTKAKNRKNSPAVISDKKSILLKPSTGHSRRVSAKNIAVENCLPTNSKAHLNVNLTLKFDSHITTNHNMIESQESLDKSKPEFVSIESIKAKSAFDYLSTNRDRHEAKH
jgi:hypothetical protein